MKGALTLAAVWFVVSLSGTAHAFNIQFLRNAPGASFSEQDWELASETADDALNHAADGESRSWENAAAGNGGTYTVEAAASRDDRPCRTLHIENYSQTAKASSQFVFCKQPDGTWAAPK